MANYSQKMGQKVSLLPARPQQGLFSTQPWPSPPWSSCWRLLPPRPFCPRQPSEPSPLPLPRVLIRPTRQSTLVASDRGGEGLQNHSESREGGGGGGPASKGTRACCHHPAPLLPKLPKFTSPELKLSSKPPSARHEGRAYFTRETQGPRRGGVVIQPASLNKSVAETGRPPRPLTSQSPLQSVPPALLGV